MIVYSRLVRHTLTCMFLSLGAYLCCPQIAHAYIGVTLSTGAIMIIGLLSFSILLALYVLVWFPIRRRLRRKASMEISAESPPDESQSHRRDDEG
jgi:hypothetical protein